MEEFYNAIDTLKGMISYPSFSREEAQVADWLQQRWQADGHNVHRKGNNLWIYAPGFDANKPTLLLDSHIDTVKPGSGWTKDLFSPEETEDGKLFGLGSNDAGASVVSLYEAFCLLSKKEQPYNLLFSASAQEEISGLDGLTSAIKEFPSVAFAVIGEPTRMQPAIAEKGLMVLDCVAHGKPGHAARDEGVNAITEAIRDIQWFNNHVFPKQSEMLGAVKMSVTMIHAGTQHNVIPGLCEFTVDVRSNEFYSNQQLYNLIKEQVKCSITPRSFRLNSSHTPAEHPFMDRIKMLGMSPFGSPTTSNQSVIPYPSVKIGPGDSARSHSADEYIHLSEIREAIGTYVHLLDNLKL